MANTNDRMQPGEGKTSSATAPGGRKRFARWPGGLRGLVLALVIGAGVLVVALGGGWRPQTGPSASEFTLEDLRAAPLDTLAKKDRAKVEAQIAVIDSLQGGSARELGDAYGGLGELYHSYDMLDAAMPAYRNAATLDPDEMRWIYLAASVLQRQGLGDVAADQFRSIIAKDPDNLQAKIRLADVLRNQGRDDEAKPLLEEILELDAENAMGHYLLGLIAAEAGDHGITADHLEAALEQQPEASSLYYPLAQAYQSMGEEALSEEALAKRGPGRVHIEDPIMSDVVGLRQDAVSMLARGNQLAQQGRSEAALQAFADAVSQEPDNVEAWVSLGAAQYQAGRRLEARDALDEALKLDPENLKAMLITGILLFQQGADVEALAILERALEAHAEDTQVRLWTGTVLRRLGRCGEAIEHLELALERNRFEESGRLNLIVCQVVEDRHEDALRTAEDGHALSPQSAPITAALIRLLSASPDISLRDGERARELAEELVESERSIDALEVHAMALAAAGDFERAASTQDEALSLADGQASREPMLGWMQENRRAYLEARSAISPWPPSVIGARD